MFEPGVYQISYDWKCKGELGRDYGRVFLASMDTYITAGEEIGRDVLSDVYVRLHNSDKLEGSTMWTTESHIVEIDKPMNYMFVVQWSNDVSDGENPPLSIDNIRVELAECGAISALNLLSVSADAAGSAASGGHQGGDTAFVKAALAYFGGNENVPSITTIERSAQSHYVAFAAEESRLRDGEKINMDTFI